MQADAPVESPPGARARKQGPDLAAHAAALLAREATEAEAFALLEPALDPADHAAGMTLVGEVMRHLLRGIDPHTRLPRGAPNPFLAILRLVRRWPWLLDGGPLWLDEPMRVNRGLALEARQALGRLGLERGPGLQHTLELLLIADGTRDLPLYDACAARLAGLLPGAGLGPVELCRYWCFCGDAALLHGRNTEAEAHYRRAQAARPEDARVLFSLGCLALDAGDLPAAAALAARAGAAFAAEGQAQCGEIVSRIAAFWATPARPLETVEVVVFCHVSGKLRANAALGAPGLGLLETGLRSLRQTVLAGAEVPMTVYYDHRLTETNSQFLGNLLRFCAAEALPLAIYTGNGLRKQWLRAFERARADAVLVIEQDHEFLAPCPSLAELLALLRDRPDINHLRLNRRRNIHAGYDRLLLQTPRDVASGLCRTSGFSNTPHLLRRDFYEAVILPIISANPRHDRHNQGAAGVEENVNGAIRRLERLLGLPGLQRLMGLAIWGPPGHKPLCLHTGI